MKQNKKKTAETVKNEEKQIISVNQPNYFMHESDLISFFFLLVFDDKFKRINFKREKKNYSFTVISVGKCNMKIIIIRRKMLNMNP